MNEIAKKAGESAQAEAKAMIAAAKKAAAERVARAKAEIEENAESALKKAQIRAEQEAKQAKIVSQAQNLRETQRARQAVIDSVFQTARKDLLGKGGKDLASTLIKKYGKSGDTVIVSKKDEKSITAEFLKGLSVKNLKREVSDKFEGGIILENASYELRLTMDDLLGNLREQVELEVSNILFN